MMNHSSPPSWFIEALTTQPSLGSVDVAGARIAYRVWGRPADAGIVLVHGSGAHGGWWDHIGPQLAGSHRVVAIDLSGHGGSERRGKYTIDRWVEEIGVVAEAAGIVGPRTIVGHSMGAFVSLRAAGDARNDVAAVLAIDPPVRAIEAVDIERRAKIVASRPKVYPTRAVAIARWCPSPPQTVLPYVRDHVAAGSVREVEGGWSWAFDPRSFDRPDIAPDDWGEIDSDVLVLRAEHGMLSAEMADVLVSRLGPRAHRLEAYGAGHHVMLDHPLAVVRAARMLIGELE